MLKPDFQKQWWTKYGNPVAGKDTTLDDRQWLKVGATILHLSPSALGAMLLALVFDEKRDRARRGLDHLRSQYKETHPTLASFWGRGRSGPRSKLNIKQYLAIGLADEFGIKKVRILREAGLIDENFDSGVDRSKYELIDRASKQGSRSPLFASERERLRILLPAERERQILAMLKRAGKRF